MLSLLSAMIQRWTFHPLVRTTNMNSSLFKTSRSISALLNESPVVIGARMGQFAQAPNSPCCLMNEMVRMVLEKQVALGESMMTMWAHAVKWQSHWLICLLSSVGNGKMPEMLPSAGEFDMAASDALAPYLKRVRLNRKRLRSGSKTKDAFDFFC